MRQRFSYKRRETDATWRRDRTDGNFLPTQLNRGAWKRHSRWRRQTSERKPIVLTKTTVPCITANCRLTKVETTIQPNSRRSAGAAVREKALEGQ
jgi:hypothetical protein